MVFPDVFCIVRHSAGFLLYEKVSLWRYSSLEKMNSFDIFFRRNGRFRHLLYRKKELSVGYFSVEEDDLS